MSLMSKSTTVVAALISLVTAFVAVAPAAQTADDIDPFQSLCEAADEMQTAPVEEVPRPERDQ